MGLSFSDNDGNFSLSNTFKVVATALTGITMLGAALGSFTMLDETERGIDYQFGEMMTKDASELRQQGFSLKAPWTTVRKMDISLQQQNLEEVVTYTKDNQTITATLAVMFKLPVQDLIKINKENPDWEAKLETTVLDAAKSALGESDAAVIAQSREKIMANVTKETAEKVKTLLGIEIVDIKMPNFDFEEAFEKSVAKAADEKATLTGMNTQLEQERVTKEKAIVIAEGKAQAVKLAADADAYASKVKMENEATGKLALAKAQAEGFNKIVDAIGRDNIQTYLNSEAWKSGGAKMPETLVTGGNATALISPAVKAAAAATAKTPAP